jgi:hypothetical protein
VILLPYTLAHASRFGGTENSQPVHYKSPQRKLVLFFAKSRDAWKTKCLEAKTAVKRLKNTVRFLESRKAHWKSRVKALERELAQLQARERDREGAIAL